MAEKSKKKSAEGGARDAMVERLFPELGGAFEGPSFSNFNLGGFGQGGGGQDETGLQRRRLEAMVDLWREKLAADQAAKSPEAVRGRLQALSEYEDPVKFAQQRKEASLADPFGPHGYFEGRRAADIMTPEEIMASQGPTAANQWASMRQPLTEGQKQNLQGPGGVKVAAQRGAGEFDPEELRRLNEQYRARRTYS